MLYFAVFVNGMSGIAAGVHLLEEATGFFIIFPVMNIANGAILLILYRFDVLDDKNISDDNGTIFEAINSLLIITILILIFKYIYEVYWAVLFSMCVFYATNINTLIHRTLLMPLYAHNKSFESGPS
jgi:hypothetical protein